MKEFKDVFFTGKLIDLVSCKVRLVHDCSISLFVLMGIPRENLPDDSVKIMWIDAILYNLEADISCGKKMSKKVDVSIRKRNTDERPVLDESSFYQS